MNPPVNAKNPEQAHDVLNEAWGYIRQPPPAAGKAEEVPAWQSDQDDIVSVIAQEFAEMDLRVAEFKQHLSSWGITPVGRRRIDLATQLAEAYLDPQRLAAAAEALTDDERHYAARLLLHFQLQDLRIQPDAVYWKDYDEDWTELVKPLVKAGLFLQDTAGNGLIVVPGFRTRLPKLHIEFPQAQDPKTFVGAADPHELLGQLQLMMGVLKSERFALRHQLKWQAPEYPYAQQAICWPPALEDARAIINNVDREHTIELLPPEPWLDQASLQRLTAALGVDENWVEFLYHLLVAIGVVWPGDPPTIDSDVAQAWMALPPQRQLVVIYTLYRDLKNWASWWPRWRQRDLHIQVVYQGYWRLMSFGNTVHTSVGNLRCAILEILSHLPDNVWISIDKLSRWLVEIFPSAENHHYLLGLDLGCEAGGWRAFLRVVLVDILTGPLYALGLVEVGPSLDKAAVVRLKDLQSVQWGRTRDVELETNVVLSPEALHFVADEQKLEVATPIPPEFMTLLLRWASPIGFSRSLIRYRLDRDKLHQVFEEGDDPDALAAAWRACVDFQPLPEILAWWQYWYERYARVRFYPPQALLQTRDALTMRELQLALPSLQALITSPLSPEAALLRPDEVDKLLDDLTRQGYMPKDSV